MFALFRLFFLTLHKNKGFLFFHIKLIIRIRLAEMLAFFGFIKKSCVLFVLFRKNFVTLQNNSINMMKIYSKKDDELLEACYSGDIETVKKFILDNEDENIFTYSPGVNTADGWNETTLHYACKGGHVDIIKFLIQHGCNIDSIARFGRTPLQLACRYEKLDAVRVLLENGADVNGLRKENTPLNTACYFNNLDIVKVLIENGANLDSTDRDGNTVLMQKTGYIYYFLRKNKNGRV